MSDTITVTGVVATAARHVVTAEGLAITSFRLASSQRRYDRTEQKWVEGDTNWYSVSCFRQLAINAAGSIGKGDRVVVTGRLRVREWSSGERNGVNVDIEADAIGFDLAWGTSTFTRSISASSGAEEPRSDAPHASEDHATEASDHGDDTPAVLEREPEPAIPF